MIMAGMIHDFIIYEIADSHQFKMPRAITQRELAQRNDLNQIQTVHSAAAYRAGKLVRRNVLEDHRTDVQCIQKIEKWACEPGYSFKIMSNVSEPNGKVGYKVYIFLHHAQKKITIILVKSFLHWYVSLIKHFA